MLTTYAQLVDYFQSSLPAKVTGINGVTVGYDEAILNAQNTQIKYPHLWVETPDVSFQGTDDNPSKRFKFAIVVMTNENKKTNPAANTALSVMLELCERVWSRILADSDDGMFDLILDATGAQPVRQWSADNCYGWRMEPINIDLPRCECEDC